MDEFAQVQADMQRDTEDERTAAVGYYGGDIANLLNETPKAPLQLHFGERDQHIPAAVAVRAAVPTLPVHTYPAGHGFNCDERRVQRRRQRRSRARTHAGIFRRTCRLSAGRSR